MPPSDSLCSFFARYILSVFRSWFTCESLILIVCMIRRGPRSDYTEYTVYGAVWKVIVGVGGVPRSLIGNKEKPANLRRMTRGNQVPVLTNLAGPWSERSQTGCKGQSKPRPRYRYRNRTQRPFAAAVQIFQALPQVPQIARERVVYKVAIAAVQDFALAILMLNSTLSNQTLTPESPQGQKPHRSIGLFS